MVDQAPSMASTDIWVTYTVCSVVVVLFGVFACAFTFFRKRRNAAKETTEFFLTARRSVVSGAPLHLCCNLRRQFSYMQHAPCHWRRADPCCSCRLAGMVFSLAGALGILTLCSARLWFAQTAELCL